MLNFQDIDAFKASAQAMGLPGSEARKIWLAREKTPLDYKDIEAFKSSAKNIGLQGKVARRIWKDYSDGALTGQVTDVIDGDTVRVGDQRVRIYDRFAPELGTAAGEEAKRILAEKIAGKNVRARIAPKRDKYGRKVGTFEVMTADGPVDLNEQFAPLPEEKPTTIPGIMAGIGAGALAGGGLLAGITAATGGLAAVPAALAFAGSNLFGGFVGREYQSYYDEQDSIFKDVDDDGYDPFENNHPADVALDLIFPYVLRGAARVGAAGLKAARGAQRTSKAMKQADFDPTILPRSLKGLIDEAAAEKEKVRAILEANKAGAGAVSDEVVPETGSQGGMALLRQLKGQLGQFYGSRVQPAVSALKRSDDPLAQSAGRLISIMNAIERRHNSLAKLESARLFDRTLKKLPRERRKQVESLLRESGHRTFGKTRTEAVKELGPDLVHLLDEYRLLNSEMLNVKRLAGVQMKDASGEFVPLLEQSDYVFSRFRRDTAKLVEDLVESGSDDGLVKYLLERGIPEERAAKIIAEIRGQPKVAKNVYAHARLRDADGVPLMPEEAYEQNLFELTENMINRDALEVAHAASWGSGATKELAGVGEVPELLADVVTDLRRRGYVRFSRQIGDVAKETFLPDSSDTRKLVSGLRTFARNAMLTKNAPLQLAEVSKATAFGHHGAKALNRGGDLLAPYAKRSGATINAMSGATESNFEALLGRATMDGLRSSRFAAAHPAVWAAKADAISRRVSGTAALGTIHGVAQEAFELGSRAPSRALLKYASEIFPRLPPEEAVRKLAGMWKAGVDARPSPKSRVLLPESEVLEGVQNLVGRFHYLTDAGEIAQFMRTPLGGAAFQYQSFMVQAARQFTEDVLKPIASGARFLATEGDATLLHLGLSRLIRSFGHQLPLSTLASVVRIVMAGNLEDTELQAISERALKETAGSAAGILGETVAIPFASDPGQALERRLSIFPGLAFGTQTAKGLLSPIDKPAKFAQSVNNLIGGAFPQAKVALDPLIGAARSIEKENN